MRIAQMLDTLSIGGAQKMQVFLVQNLVPLGIEVTVINLRSDPNPVMVAELENAGAHVVTIPFQRLFSPVSFFKLVWFMRQGKFDLLQTYLTYSNIIGSFAGRLSHTPVIASVRNSANRNDKKTQLRMRFENFTLKYVAQRITANGYSVAEFVQRRLGIVEIDLILNSVAPFPAVNPDERAAIRRSIVGNSDEKIIIFSAGRLAEIKGFSFLIRAFNEIQKKFPDTLLVIAGEGKDREKLESQIRELGLQDSVCLLGNRNDIRRLLCCVDIYVNSSLWEGTPVSLMEAMSAELPIVATTVGDNPYLLDNNAGVLVPPSQPSQLATAISSLITDPAKAARLGQVAGELVTKNYNPAFWRHNLLRIYSQVTPKAKEYLELSNSESGVYQ